jgi:hypothetical protein
MNSNISNNSNNNSYISNNINKCKLRTKRSYGALQNQYPDFYTTTSKKFKYSNNPNDSNMNTIAFNSDNNNKKNAAVFSSFSNDVEMNSQNYSHNTSKYLDSYNLDIKRYLIYIYSFIFRQYYDKIKQEMSNYKTQTNKCSSRMRVNYDCCDN